MAFSALKLKTPKLSWAFQATWQERTVLEDAGRNWLREGQEVMWIPSLLPVTLSKPFILLHFQILALLMPSGYTTYSPTLWFLIPTSPSLQVFCCGPQLPFYPMLRQNPHPFSLSPFPLSPAHSLPSLLTHADSRLHHDYRSPANPLHKLPFCFHPMHLAKSQPS